VVTSIPDATDHPGSSTSGQWCRSFPSVQSVQVAALASSSVETPAEAAAEAADEPPARSLPHRHGATSRRPGVLTRVAARIRKQQITRHGESTEGVGVAPEVGMVLPRQVSVGADHLGLVDGILQAEPA
jgi:hypothetical protein